MLHVGLHPCGEALLVLCLKHENNGDRQRLGRLQTETILTCRWHALQVMSFIDLICRRVLCKHDIERSFYSTCTE